MRCMLGRWERVLCIQCGRSYARYDEFVLFLPRFLDRSTDCLVAAERKKITGIKPDPDDPRIIIINPWEMAPSKANEYQESMKEISVAYREADKRLAGAEKKRKRQILLPNSLVRPPLLVVETILLMPDDADLSSRSTLDSPRAPGARRTLPPSNALPSHDLPRAQRKGLPRDVDLVRRHSRAGRRIATPRRS